MDKVREPKARVPTTLSQPSCSFICNKIKNKLSKTTIRMKTQTTTSHPLLSSSHRYTSSKEDLQKKQDPRSRAKSTPTIRPNFPQINECQVTEVDPMQARRFSLQPSKAEVRFAKQDQACSRTALMSKMITMEQSPSRFNRRSSDNKSQQVLRNE